MMLAGADLATNRQRGAVQRHMAWLCRQGRRRGAVRCHIMRPRCQGSWRGAVQRHMAWPRRQRRRRSLI